MTSKRKRPVAVNSETAVKMGVFVVRAIQSLIKTGDTKTRRRIGFSQGEPE